MDARCSELQVVGRAQTQRQEAASRLPPGSQFGLCETHAFVFMGLFWWFWPCLIANQEVAQWMGGEVGHVFYRTPRISFGVQNSKPCCCVFSDRNLVFVSGKM